MRSSNRNSKRKHHDSIYRSVCAMLVFSAIIAGIFIFGLGILRFCSYNLECEIAEVNQQIYELEIKQLELTRSLSMLRSPERIFCIARNSLGMEGASRIMTVKVASRNGAGDVTEGALAANSDSYSDRNGLHLFVKKANAGN